ncbi:MAG: glycosyltransferase [Nitrosotalea sp.]
MATDATNILKLSKFPRVSIIIPTYDQVDLFRRNLTSIESKTTYKNYEIIIITNNLDENSQMRKYLKTIKHRVLIFQKSYSFGDVNNFAAKEANGEYLLFLNDDVEIVSPNWLESLLYLALDDKVGAVGGKLLFPNGKLQEAGCIVWKNGSAWNYGRNGNPDDPIYNFVRDVDYCSGSCLLIKKKIFDQLGGFDLQYFPAYAEDSDICLSIAKLGYRILYQPLACIIHHEGQTQGTDVQTGIKSYQIENINKFREKWKDFLESRDTDLQENSYLERNRKSGINILYVDHYVPEYDKDAGSLTTYYVLSILSLMGHKVTFWPDNLHKTEPYTTELQQRGIEVIYGPTNFESFLKERKNNFCLAVVSRAHIAPKYIDIIKKHSPSTKIMYETIDLSFVRELREAELENNPIKLEQAKQTEQRELVLIQKSDITSVKSKKEANLLLTKDSSLTMAIIPPIQITKEKVPQFDSRKDLIFLGGFQHPPNMDSLMFLLNEIFPLIKKKVVDINLYVIGSNPPQKIKDLCSKTEGVIFLGYVKDIEPYLEKCRLMVAPLRYGAGVKGKITQSLAYGLPVVTTPTGAEGIVFDDANFLTVANNPHEFVEKTIDLYNDKQKWTKISEAGISHIDSYFSPELLKETLSQIVARCVDNTSLSNPF